MSSLTFSGKTICEVTYLYSKYHNTKTVADGIKFDSKLEAERYAQLKILERAGSMSLYHHSRRTAKHGVKPCIKPISGTSCVLMIVISSRT